MLNLCANQNRTSMKTTLLVVGRTVEQHFITAINDYVQRTKRYLSFEMEVIPELKNTKSLSMEVQINPEKPDVPLNKNDAFQKVQKRRVQEKR